MLTLEELSTLEQRLIWDKDYAAEPGWLRAIVALARTLLYLYHEFSNGALNLRAMSLVYTTILSLVPLIAFSFSVLKGFGVQNQVEPVLLEYLAALGPEKSLEITEQVVAFVNNIDVRVLGAVGLGLLVWTIVTLMQKIEGAFNHAWHVVTERSFAERFTTFVSVLTVGPLLVFAAIAITGSVMNNSLMLAITNHEPFGTIAAQATRMSPYFLVIGAFTFLYVLIPNTRVRFYPALIGGIAAGLLWESAGYVFAYVVATASKYQAVYATFGTAMLFMVWMYVSWLILLVGASVAYFVQNPRIVIARARKWRFNFETYEAVALAALVRIVQNHYAGEAPMNSEQLSELQGVPPELIDKVVHAFSATNILSPTSSKPPAYVLAVPPEETTIVATLRSLRRHQAVGSRRVQPVNDAMVEMLREKIDVGLDYAFGDMKLKSLAREAEHVAALESVDPTTIPTEADAEIGYVSDGNAGAKRDAAGAP